MYISTRNNHEKVSASMAIKLGMVPAGGLFVPEETPALTRPALFSMRGASYQETAGKILALYLEDFTLKEIGDSVYNAYNTGQFSHKDTAPLHKLNESIFILELWHGPTAAFKDMALQVMPHLLSQALKKANTATETVILVATSGDTGKAALEGFKNVTGIKIIVFFPYGGVSKVQELQMTTTEGDNTYVVAVKGNFDDCQSAVKQVFGDANFKEVLKQKGYELSSANSINWGRLAPQVVYYVYSYLRLLEQKEITAGEKINFVVPTGNFGNILAGWYAWKMGLPVQKLICASNENKVLTDFFQTGVYDRNREFFQTRSPSMDILISSNLERFLFEMVNHDGGKIAGWMGDLNKQGSFAVDKETMSAINTILAADYATEKETLETIKKVFDTTGYTLDPHTAVGMSVYEKYAAQTKDPTKTILVSTASPFKFNSSVLEAIRGRAAVEGKDEFQILRDLEKITGLPIHPALRDLDKKTIRHDRFCEKNGIKGEIEEILGI